MFLCSENTQEDRWTLFPGFQPGGMMENILNQQTSKNNIENTKLIAQVYQCRLFFFILASN